jgi:tRNA A-37 threonylcarbamoyl transferase component Bud32
MCVVAASFVGFIALFAYQMFWGPPALPGYEGSFSRGGLVVLAVHPNSAEERAGLRAGDRVLAIDGQVIRNLRDREAIRANTEIGRPEQWEISRTNERLQLTLTFSRPPWREWLSLYGREGLGYILFILTSLGLGLIIAFRRPFDPVARVGAWLLATAAFTFGFPDGWAATWRHLPVWLGLFLWIPEISRFVPDAILLTFFAIFPRRIFQARWPWLLVWTPALALLPWRVFAAYQVIYQPGHATEAPVWVFSAISLRSIVYAVSSLAILLLSYRRLEDVNQRRRVRIVLAGLMLSTLGVVSWVATGSGRGLSYRLAALQAVVYVLLFAFPLSFTYAILRHRLFDVGVMIRQGLQYALARDVLVFLVPALVAAMLGDILLHRERPLLEILRARGWVYIVLGGLAATAYVRRQRWMEVLDQRFFRDRYDAQRLLREVAEGVREAGSIERVAPSVVARIEAALHPEFVAVLVREPREASYHSLAAAPAGQAPAALPADSKALALMRLLGKPLEVSLAESGWLKQQLPHEETDYFRQARIDMLVPISSASESREALLALGIKRSEEPYSREDQDLLMAIAASLALLLDKAAAVPAGPGAGLEECPECGVCYDTGVGRCAQEDARLVPMRLPRTLAGRYRLERCRGKGGMGAVYEATDKALERRVAVKVIRDDLVGSADAGERFRQEARTTASFSHPNVVAVYDFGVAADTRAFLVMELLEGTSLRQELKQQGRLAPQRTVEVLRSVCAAVEAAHRRQLVHRDLKPENIFLARSETGETVKVLDFGIAKFLPKETQATADTASGLVVGTLHYVAPERLLGAPADAAWDVWALAVVAYEMLTGALPFAAATTADYHNAVLSGRFAPVATYLPDSPAYWQEFFARTFARERDRRPNSARMFFSELERALS